MHKTTRPVAVERGHAERHAQRTGTMPVNNLPKARCDLRERLIPRNRIEPRAISSSAHGCTMHRARQTALPGDATAGAEGTRRARMPRHRKLGHHATVLNACRKGAIGIASPACVTTARPSRFTADAISITPFISQTQQANNPATSPRPKKPPARQRPAGGPTSNRRHLTPRTSWRR